jgi:hypothetical protein
MPDRNQTSKRTDGYSGGDDNDARVIRTGSGTRRGMLDGRTWDKMTDEEAIDYIRHRKNAEDMDSSGFGDWEGSE